MTWGISFSSTLFNVSAFFISVSNVSKFIDIGSPIFLKEYFCPRTISIFFLGVTTISFIMLFRLSGMVIEGTNAKH